MKRSLTTIWVLLGNRAGDNAQALELARRVGGLTVQKQLHYNRLAAFPNWLTGAGFGTLAKSVREAMQPPWPQLVIATGRKTARISLAIKDMSDGLTRCVQIGRPRLPLSRFDLVLTSPQYGLPPAGNVLEMPLPFAVPQIADADLKQNFLATWSDLPRPWIVGVIGAAKFPVKLGMRELDGFAEGVSALARKKGGSVILIDSPRSATGALQRVSSALSVPHWMWQRGVGANPYQAALALADMFAITSDSVSMVAEMVQSHKPVFVYRLPVSSWVPKWSAQSGVMAAMARRGCLSPPRDVQKFVSYLDGRGWIGDLHSGRAPHVVADIESDFEAAVARVNLLLSG